MTWRFQQIKPQKARGKLNDDYWDSHDWTAEEKWDGFREVAQFCSTRVRFTGSEQGVGGTFVEKTDNVPHLAGIKCGVAVNGKQLIIKPPATLDGTVLDGELVVPKGFVCGAGGRSKYMSMLVGGAPETSIGNQIKYGFVRYAVFDCLYYHGRDVRSERRLARRAFVEKALREWRNPHAFLCDSVGNSSKRKFLEQIWARGGEGVVLKHVEHRYGDQLLWVKVKFEATADVVIMGFKPASEMSEKINGEVSPTKYADKGWIGAIIFGQYQGGKLVKFGSTSGFDETIREELSENQKTYLGEVIRIKHYGREPTGFFRHPQFDAFRPDKNAKDCVFDMNEA